MHMTVPTSIIVECPLCKDETLHEVVSGKVGGKAETVLDSTVRCRECGHVHHVIIKAEKPVDVPVIISWVKESQRSSVALGRDEALSVGDEFMCGEIPVIVTSIEAKGARVLRAKAGNIGTIWAKKFDKVRVHFSINHQGKSHSEIIEVIPDEEFFIGDMMTVGKREVVIHAIKIDYRTLKTGSALARDIIRIYANIVRTTSQ